MINKLRTDLIFMNKLQMLQNALHEHMNAYGYDSRMIHALTHDTNVLCYVQHCLNTYDEYNTLSSLMDDNGFHEFLHAQYETPITFDEMKLN